MAFCLEDRMKQRICMHLSSITDFKKAINKIIFAFYHKIQREFPFFKVLHRA